MIIHFILLLVYSVNFRINSEQTPNEIRLKSESKVNLVYSWGEREVSMGNIISFKESLAGSIRIKPTSCFLSQFACRDHIHQQWAGCIFGIAESRMQHP